MSLSSPRTLAGGQEGFAIGKPARAATAIANKELVGGWCLWRWHVCVARGLVQQLGGTFGRIKTRKIVGATSPPFRLGVCEVALKGLEDIVRAVSGRVSLYCADVCTALDYHHAGHLCRVNWTA